MSLRDLYQEMIVDHGRHPRNHGKLDNANRCQTGHNPLCGDKMVFYVLEQNGTISDIRFEGTGCAISIASASLMSETVKGKSLAEVKELFASFYKIVTMGAGGDENMGKLAVFSGVAEFPVRVKCATLAWHTLNAALANSTAPVTTE